MTEEYGSAQNVLERWAGKYVRLTRGRRRELTGRIEAVGRDGIIFQPLDNPRQTKELATPHFYPWHEIN
jgi:hypothetical protein